MRILGLKVEFVHLLELDLRAADIESIFLVLYLVELFFATVTALLYWLHLLTIARISVQIRQQL